MVRDAPSGVYLDMISMVQDGEGALVGSTAKALCYPAAQQGVSIDVAQWKC